MANTTHYRIRDYDTLESIAGRFLGDPDRWIDIVTANNLRYPFISDDPKYQYGVVLESGQLGYSIAPGITHIDLILSAHQLATKNGVLLIEQTGTNGKILQEALTLSEDGLDLSP